MVIPQQVYDSATRQPCLVYSIDTDGRHVRFAGSDTLVKGRLQIDCYARTYAQVKTLADAVRDALIDYSGTMTAATSPVTSVTVKRIFLEDGENELMDEEPGLYRVMQRYVIWYDEA
jgi:hypothetical protein